MYSTFIPNIRPERPIRIFVSIFFVFYTTILFGVSAYADVFLLRNAGKIEGELLNPREVPRKTYQIKTENGLEIELESKAIERVRKGERETLLEYNAFAPFEEDTVENHLRIAAWCRENLLPELSQKHLLQVLEHDEDHKEARQILGHFKADDGTWTTRKEFLGRSGLIPDKNGRYRTQQQIDVDKILEERKKSAVYWEKRITQLRNVLPGNGKARSEMLAINDAAATKALVEALSAERNEDVRILLVKALSNIGNSGALHSIARWAISPNEPVREVRRACFEELKKHPAALPAMIGMYISQLNPEFNNNRTINAAAFALGEIDGKTAVPYLIDALVTTHQRNIVQKAPAPTFDGSGNMVMGGGQRQITVREDKENSDVLNALIRLTGANFQYNKALWKSWLIESRKTPSFNARRGG